MNNKIKHYFLKKKRKKTFFHAYFYTIKSYWKGVSEQGSSYVTFHCTDFWLIFNFLTIYLFHGKYKINSKFSRPRESSSFRY